MLGPLSLTTQPCRRALPVCSAGNAWRAQAPLVWRRAAPHAWALAHGTL